MKPEQEHPPRSWPAGWKGADAVFFDCDSTLVEIEGIDELARRRGTDVAVLTADAMEGRADLSSVYRRRLEIIRPTAADLSWLGARYGDALLPGVPEVVAVLRQLGIAVHVVSGGLEEPVRALSALLGLDSGGVHAVPFEPGAPDAVARACAHPLAGPGGKAAVIEEAGRRAGIPRERRMLVGDGVSDLEASESCGLFAGFGGVVARPRVRAEARVWISGRDLAPAALLAAGPDRFGTFEKAAPLLYEKGCRALADPAQVLVRNP